jgi:hypothetical protein
MPEMITPPQNSTISNISAELENTQTNVFGNIDGIPILLAQIDKAGICISPGIALHNLDQDIVAHAISVAQEDLVNEDQ